MRKDPPVYWDCFLLYDRNPEQRWSFGEDRRNETLSYRVGLSRNGKNHATRVVPPCDGPRAHLRALGSLMPQVWGLAKELMDDEQFSLWPPADQASLCRAFARVTTAIASEVERKAKAIAEDAEDAEAAENAAKDSIEDLVQV